jgi:hypothetical protein
MPEIIYHSLVPRGRLRTVIVKQVRTKDKAPAGIARTIVGKNSFRSTQHDSTVFQIQSHQRNHRNLKMLQSLPTVLVKLFEDIADTA